MLHIPQVQNEVDRQSARAIARISSKTKQVSAVGVGSCGDKSPDFDAALARDGGDADQVHGDAYQEQLKQFSMQTSMSRKADCWDNAPMESFWGSLKNELVHHRRFATREQARREITEYIEIFYNRIRKQARLGYRSPAAFNLQYHAKQIAA